jgi:hypothetical protein
MVLLLPQRPPLLHCSSAFTLSAHTYSRRSTTSIAQKTKRIQKIGLSNAGLTKMPTSRRRSIARTC